MSVMSAETLCQLREMLAARIGASRFRTWFGDSTHLELADSVLRVVVPNTFVGTWIASNYHNELAETAREILGADARVDVCVAERAQSQRVDARAATPMAGTGGRARAAVRSAALRAELDSFVVGPNNRLAFAAAQAVARNPGQTTKLLVLHGGCGLGKTHLLHGICNAIARQHPTLEWRLISGEEFTNEFVTSLKANRIDAFRARFRKVDVLVVDDIHFLANKKVTQAEFLHTFNAIDSAGKAVVLASDRHPRLIATLSEPLLDRLISGMVIPIEPPDYPTRLEIVRRRAAGMNCRVTDEVLEYVAQRITRNVRELEGALYKLVALAALSKDPLPLALARAALDEQLAGAPRAPASEDIERTVSLRFEVSREQIHSRSRDRTVSLARAIAMFLVRRHCAMSFPEIGRAFGHKNHSTVLMATQRVQRWLDADATVKWRSPRGTHEALLRGLMNALTKEFAFDRTAEAPAAAAGH